MLGTVYQRTRHLLILSQSWDILVICECLVEHFSDSIEDISFSFSSLLVPGGRMELSECHWRLWLADWLQ